MNAKTNKAKLTDIRGTVFFHAGPGVVTDKDGKTKKIVRVHVPNRTRLPHVSAAAVTLINSGQAFGTIVRESTTGQDKLGAWNSADIWLRDQSGQVHHLATLDRKRGEAEKPKPDKPA